MSAAGGPAADVSEASSGAAVDDTADRHADAAAAHTDTAHTDTARADAAGQSPATPPSAADYLAAADAMLQGAGSAGAGAVDGGWWPRACACLVRLALERGLDSFWARINPAIGASRTQRAKLLMLRRYVAADTGRRIGYAWATLSRLAHHQVGESSPTAAELRRLHADVTDLLGRLGPP